MFRLREKLKYMALGSLLILAGFILGNMDSDTDAQSESERIGELTVRELTVLEDITVIGDNGNRRVVISWDEDGGRVTCFDSEEIRAAGLSISENGGLVAVVGREGGGASLSVDEEGGGVSIFPADGKTGGAGLGIMGGDGVAFTIDRFGEYRSLGQ